jgi:hypothetical protein
MANRYAIGIDDVYVTVMHAFIECVTWESGARFRRRYVGYSRRDAVREFRREYTLTHAR